MIRKLTVVSLSLVLFSAALFGADAPLRKTIVMARGDRIVYNTAAPIATVNTPAGTNEGRDQVVRFAFEQYDRSLAIEALKSGEAKLLIEGTASRIDEVVKVIVVDSGLAARYRTTIGLLAGIPGLTAEDVHVAGNQVVVAGEVYSVGDLNRCNQVEAQSIPSSGRRSRSTPAPLVVCLARLSSAAPTIFPDRGYDPAVSLEIEEQVTAIADASMTGAEGESMWTGTVRMGDIPVLTMDSANRAGLISKVANLAQSLEKAAAEWKAEAQKNQIYPTVFKMRQIGGKYDISMIWKFDQGTKGESLIQISPQEIQHASTQAGGASDRIISWWTAILQDAFRMYYLGQRPSGTLSSSSQDPLLPLYENAVRLTSGKFDRSNAPVALARAYYSLKASSGKDPFANLLTEPPSDFTAEQAGR